MRFSRISGIVKRLYSKHLFATNVVTCGTLYGVGDIAIQKIGQVEGFHKPGTDWNRVGELLDLESRSRSKFNQNHNQMECELNLYVRSVSALCLAVADKNLFLHETWLRPILDWMLCQGPS